MRLINFIALSLLLHILIKSGLFSLADDYLKEHPKHDEVKVELVEPAKAQKTPQEKALIKQMQALNAVDNDNPQARFDSEKRQRVAKETRARNIGLTQNSFPQQALQQAENQARPQPQREQQRERRPSTPDGELPEFTRMNFSRTQQQQQAQQSAISQVLPNDIQVADATNLNTDANTYYSFYSRVEELFYVRWGERLRSHWDRLPLDFKRTHLAGHVWMTTIEVLLNSRGEYYSSKIFQESGYPPFDQAAVFAFKDAKFFPNPPKEKVDPDGFVRLHYRLAVQVGEGF